MKTSVIVSSFLFATLLCACGGNGGGNEPYQPRINPVNFSSNITNLFLPFAPGTKFIYREVTPGGVARIEVTVTNDTKVIMGVTCIVVRDTVSEGGKLVEDTFDWYAQDLAGNVWYFGEATKSYDGGKVSTAGSWEAGVNGAQPGIVMKAIPVVGPPYRQEFLEGEAEDMSQIIGVGESVTVPYGSFVGCIRTKDWTPLEPDTVENKWFCPNLGEVRSEVVEGGTETVELLSVTH